MTSAIHLQGVTKRYGDFTAVNDLSLDVREGELFAFLGPNGAGKTTTIKMIAGLLTANAGLVEVCGHRMGTDGRAAKAQIAYLPDQPFLYDKLTGGEFLEFVGQMYGLPLEVIRKRSAALIERLEMGRFLDQLTEGYSHGLKQRTALASALLHEPRVLVIDEPMVGLDPRTVGAVKNLIKEMSAAGQIVFMSTHTLEVAEVVADRIGIIHQGRLVALGTLAELRAQLRAQGSLEDIFLGLTAETQQGDQSQAETIPV